MRPIKFPQANVNYAENQPEYITLPSHKEAGDPHGIVTSCWKMTWRERLLALLTGEVWLSVMSFNMPLQPVTMNIDNPIQPKPAAAPWDIKEINEVLQPPSFEMEYADLRDPETGGFTEEPKKSAGGIDMSAINEELKK